MDGGRQQESRALAVRAAIKEAQNRQRAAAQGRRGRDRHVQDPERAVAAQARRVGRRETEEAVPLATSLESPATSAQFDLPTLADISIDFTTMYLDYVFPFLFPHYRPTLFEGGRAWVLATLQTQKPLYHTAMSLATYFVALLTQTKTTPPTTTTGPKSAWKSKLAQPDETLKTVCGRYVWDILGKHMDEAIRAVQDELASLSPARETTTLAQSTRMLVNIVQLQIFEMSMGAPDGGETRGLHLVAACDLFDDMLQQHGSLSNIIAKLDRPFSDALQGPGWRIWNTDQGAFRFTVSVLLYMDIVSSTTRRAKPRLQRWHACLISQQGENMGNGERLALEDFVGCAGWVFVLVGEIAALDTWKARGCGDPANQRELPVRAEAVSRRIHDGLGRLGLNLNLNLNLDATGSADLGDSTPTPSDTSPYLQTYYRPDGGAQRYEQTLITRIWAFSALLYLETVTRRCDCNDCTSQTMQDNVATVLQLLQQVSSPAVLRGLTWPLFVAGNMAMAEQQETIRAIVATAGPLQKFGGLASTLLRLEETWTQRGRPHNGIALGVFDWANGTGTQPVLI